MDGSQGAVLTSSCESKSPHTPAAGGPKVSQCGRGKTMDLESVRTWFTKSVLNVTKSLLTSQGLRTATLVS